jgi:hypothetical protein
MICIHNYFVYVLINFKDNLYITTSCASLTQEKIVCFHCRKKKLTNHWRNFIRPLMWRCKWTELKIKEIESQASKYSREIAAYDQRKHLGFDQLTSEGLGSKSLPFSRHCYRKKAIKRRRKRKRVEDTADITSYMSQHNLFSYLGTRFFFILDGFGAFPPPPPPPPPPPKKKKKRN